MRWVILVLALCAVASAQDRPGASSLELHAWKAARTAKGHAGAAKTGITRLTTTAKDRLTVVEFEDGTVGLYSGTCEAEYEQWIIVPKGSKLLLVEALSR